MTNQPNIGPRPNGQSAPRILVVGYNAWDVNLSVEKMPGRDEKYEVPEIRTGGGGPGATAAFALARLGAEVGLMTQFGDDLPAQLQINELEAEGVNLDWCLRAPGYASPQAVILVHPQTGDRSIFWCRGDLPTIDPAEVKPACLLDKDLLYTDGHEPLATVALAKTAADLGLPVVMDAGSVREGSADVVAVSTDVVSSETFAPRLTACSHPRDALIALQKRGPRNVAMTFGQNGVLALLNDRLAHVPAYRMSVVDTTGAGDAFHAGYALARAKGGDFLACLDFGSAVAALKCRDFGGRRGLPTLAEAEKLQRDGQRHEIAPEFAALTRTDR